jgi:hypothetical protein
VESHWAEVGVTQGWYTQNVYAFYSGHSTSNGFVGYLGAYATLGHDVRFKLYKRAGYSDVVARYDDLSSGQFGYWYLHNHTGPFEQWQIGGEWTCADHSRIDKTYVHEDQYRRASDGVWTASPAPPATLITSGISGTGIAWCTRPITLRYWAHSSISISGCN